MRYDKNSMQTSANMDKEVRILMLGEPGVGKTSLINSLIAEEFDEKSIPRRMKDITIPPDVTPEKVPTHLIDYSVKEQNDNDLCAEIGRANVICIVFALDVADSIAKIEDYWIPKIDDVRRESNSQAKKPILLIGNKSDLQDSTLEVIHTLQAILHIMNKHSEIETCVECSAKSLKNVSEVFYYAQKAVLHPTSPLYDADLKELTIECKQALSRIFKIIDHDNNNHLSDQDLQRFQRRCFNIPLQSQALEDVKNVVRKHIPDGVQDDHLTCSGFLFIQRLFIQRGRHETTWTVLRCFGYNDKLQIPKSYLTTELEVPEGCSVEFSHAGFQFIQDLFSKYDKDKDDCLSPDELDQLFSTCETNPWPDTMLNSIHTNPNKWITKDGYISKWVLQMSQDPHETLRQLIYLGYMYQNDRILSAIQVTRSRKVDLRLKHTSRTTFQINVLGTKNSGKLQFCQSLVGNSLDQVRNMQNKKRSRFTCNGLQIYGHNNFLVLHDIDVEEGVQDCHFNCDAICLIYDQSDEETFRQCVLAHEQYLRRREFIPVILICCQKSRVASNFSSNRSSHSCPTPGEFVRKYNLQPGMTFNCHNINNSEIFYKLTTIASYPHLVRNQDSTFSNLGRVLLASVVVGAIGYALYRYNKSEPSSSTSSAAVVSMPSLAAKVVGSKF